MIIDRLKRPLRYARGLWRNLGMRLHLEKKLRTQAPVTVENFDFETTKRRVLRFLESLRVTGEDYRYRYSQSCTQPTLYASAYGCMTKSLLGDLVALDQKQRAEWVAYFDSFQNPEDGLYYDQVVHNDIYADTDSVFFRCKYSGINFQA